MLIFGAGGISRGIVDALPKCPVNELYGREYDVRFPEAVEGAIRTYDPEWIVNCAGVSLQNLHGGSRQEIETNLIGAFNVAESSPSIPQIHIASVAGLYGKPGHAGYSASKAGVISMVQSLALEGRDIWAISPGRVDTPMRQRDYPNDTPGSRLLPIQVGGIVRRIMEGEWESGTNVVIRKEGLDTIHVEAHTGDGWKERLRVGEPVTI